MLEFVEEAFDQVSLAIEGMVDRALSLAVALGGNVGGPAPRGDQVDEVLPVVTAVGDHVLGRRQAVEEGRCGGLVRGLSGAQQETQRQPSFIDDGVDLGAQSSTRTANGVIRAPFLPPAACWWARMIEESINWSDCGERVFNASKILSHTPALAHRL